MILAPHPAAGPGPIRRQVLLREVVLAALPAVLTVALLFFAARPGYAPLLEQSQGWKPYAYQGLAQDVQAYRIALLDPAEDAASRRVSWQIALSSAANPGQFKLLSVVEGYGEARLGHIEALLRQNTPRSVAAAAREAVTLSAQASNFTYSMRETALEELTLLRWVLVSAGSLTGLLSLLLTGRALMLWRAERERQSRREARQREALSLASHELRRPLQSLLLASDLLRQAGTPEQRQHLLTLIEDSAAQIASRADLTRLQALYVDVSLEVTPTDLREVVEVSPDSRVTVRVPPQPVVWSVDAARLRQIVENLVENALKYTSGPVEVTLDVLAGRPEITVRDAGPGIAPGLREGLFLPFQRGPGRHDSGQGLGLALVRRYARAHGGEVTLEDAPGGGTLARVTLGEPASRAPDLDTGG